ncbi:MAG: hypothetical protein C0593_11300 [Marinilabiliales bacterium]|nr:MAG: hypothetical protein C0593_11300 [Marinilabiliales bacterium]
MRYAHKNITIHSIIPTLDYRPLIDDITERLIRMYIFDQCINMNIDVYHLEFSPNHVHLIHQLNPRIPLCDTIQNIKGGSSHYVNASKLIPSKFAWNPGPIYFSLGNTSTVKEVIKTFENHRLFHQTFSLQEEIAALREKYPALTPISKEN